MKRIVLLLTFVLASPMIAQAHFLWLLTNSKAGPGKVEVFFSEAAEADDPALLDKVTKAEVWSVGGRGEPKLIELKKGADSLEGELTGQSQQNPAILRHSYGVSDKGGKPFLLKYYAKTYPFALPGTWKAVKDNDRLPLEIVPQADANGIKFRVTWNGKPQADAMVTIVGPGIPKKIEGTTDEAGNYRCELPKAGLFSIRTKLVEETAGKLDDKEYQSVRHYSTLSLHYVPSLIIPAATDLPALPKGITSFGGAIIGDTMFAYGGNYGSSHEFSNEDQSGDLWKLDLKKPGKWEKGPGGPKVQGLAMVAYKGSLYRVGGFTAMNKHGQKDDLRSQADFARLSPNGTAWESLPSLPEPRSSHDAAIIGDTLYVVGGWNMQGGDPANKWQDTALSMNLASDKLEWKTIATPPFKRRALAVTGWNGKLYCIGGMKQEGEPTTAVAVYDPAKDSWSEGPSLLGGNMDGFGSSAFACQGSLFVTTISGSIQRLNSAGTGWEYVGQLAHPRFHRLLSTQDEKLIVYGGSSMMTGKVEALELIPVAHADPAKK